MPPLFADHNFPKPAVERLRTHGYDVVASREIAFARANDDEALAFSSRTGRFLLTHDIDGFELLPDAWRRWTTE